MYISEKILKLIFILLIGVATVLSILTLYFYLPSLINRLGLNKTPSKEIQELLTNYNMTQTPEIYKAMDEKVMKIAQTTPSIDISKCTPYPRIFKADNFTRIKVNNSDEQAHTITVEGKSFTVRGVSSTIIQLNFVTSDADVLPYSCDDLNTLKGIFYITKRM